MRTDLQLRSEIIHTAPAPGLNLPDELQGYHTLVPLESVAGERRKFGNWYSTVYRATGKDGHAYVLRRVSGMLILLPHSRIIMSHRKDFRLMHQAAFQPIEQWSRLRHPNIVAVHEAFTTRSFGDNCPSLALFSSLFLNLAQRSWLPIRTTRVRRHYMMHTSSRVDQRSCMGDFSLPSLTSRSEHSGVISSRLRAR